MSSQLLPVGALPALPFGRHSWQCAQGPDAVKDCFSEYWAPLIFSGPFLPGETVAVDQGSNLKHCHAIVLPDDGAQACSGGGKACVRATRQALLADEVLAADELAAPIRRRLLSAPRNVPAEGAARPLLLKDLASHAIFRKAPTGALTRVLPATSPRVLLVTDTQTYRRLAKLQVGRYDAVLEVGSALGDCTRILTAHATAVVGIDVSGDFVEESRRRHPQCRFEWMDLFEEPTRLRSICDELAMQGTLKIFVDVGGDRITADVCRVLAALGEATAPALVVVKCRALAASAAATCGADGVVSDVAEWWQCVARPGPPGSKAQWKRKLGRALRAKPGRPPDAWERFLAKWEIDGVPPPAWWLLGN